MNREQALEKIKKCMALSKSSNVHEAANAMRQAQKLMEQHQLSETDVSLADVTEADTTTSAAEIRPWESRLAGVVGDAFGCEYFFRSQLLISDWGRLRKDKMRIVFVGVGAAAEVASYTYSVLERQLLRDRLAHVKAQPTRCKPATKTARGDEFAVGWVRGVEKIVGAFSGRQSDQQLVSQYMSTKHPDLKGFTPKDRTRGRNISNNDHMLGIRAGQQAQLNQGVGATQQGLLT